MLWVLVDEDARASMTRLLPLAWNSPQWFDAPGTYHNGGCGFAFADGHSETHRWMTVKKASGGAVITDPADQQDWEWMQQRTSARILNSDFFVAGRVADTKYESKNENWSRVHLD